MQSEDTRAPRVSVGVPVYNGAVGIAEALDSLVNQTILNIEIIISDNASTDATPEICRRYADKDPRIIYFRQPSTISIVDNFTFVLRKARAPYFMWAAHDDVRSSDFVEKLLAALESNTNAVLAFGDAVDVWRGDSVSAKARMPTPGTPRWQKVWMLAFTRFHFVYGLWRTDVLRRLKLVKNDWWLDLPLMMSASMLGDFVQVSGPELKYRVKGDVRYFDLPHRSGIDGFLMNLRIRARRAWHMGRAPLITAVSVGRVAGLGWGIFAGGVTCLKVAHSAIGYFWHWLRVEFGMLPKRQP